MTTACLSYINLLNFLAFFPHPGSYYALLAESACPVLLAILPLALVVAPIRPCEYSKPVLLVFVVLACVFAAVGPLQLTVPMHLVLVPCSCVLPSIGPAVYALSCDVVGDELSAVVVAIGPHELPVAILVSLLIATDELASVGPVLDTTPVLQIIEPVAAVSTAVRLQQDAESVGLVRTPLSLVNIAATMNQTAVKVRHVVLPVAFVETAIWPDLAPTALSNIGP